MEKSHKLKSLEGEYAKITRKQDKTKQLLQNKIAREYLAMYHQPATSLLWLLTHGTRIFQEWTPATGFQWRVESENSVKPHYRDNDYIPFQLENALQILGYIQKQIIVESLTYKFYEMTITPSGDYWLGKNDWYYTK